MVFKHKRSKRFLHKSGNKISASHAGAFGVLGAEKPKIPWFYPLAFALLLVFVLVLIFLVFVQFSRIDYLSSELSVLRAEHLDFVSKSEIKIGELNSSISDLSFEKQQLELRYLSLSKMYSELESKNAVISSSYADLKSEALATIAKIDSYKREIQSSMDWFSANSVLSKNEGSVLTYLNSSCIKNTNGTCEVNLGCFYFVNSELLKFKYASDFVTSNTVDKLQSVSSFYSNRRGDCEDFSLFYKAEYNSLLTKCADKPVSLFAWVDKNGKNFDVTSAGTWYIGDADKKYLAKENLRPAIVCGSMFDLQSGQVNGHCVIAFGSKRIVSVSDIDSLLTAELVEPQNGKYLGIVGQDSGIYLVDSLGSGVSYIDTIITDNDFFIFRDRAWNSYSSFYSDLSESGASLQKLAGE